MADADFRFEAAELDPEALRVLRFSGSEGMSRCFRHDIELVSPDPEVDFAAVVGKPAFLWLHGDEEERWIHGVVTRFEQVGKGRVLTYYRARLQPKLWTLSLRRRSQIFQDLKLDEIVAAVLEEGGIASDEQKWDLARRPIARKYCVQYRESDLDFVSRLLEEEGIAYHFVHTEDGCTVLFGDAPGSRAELPGDPELHFEAGEVGLLGKEHVSRFAVGRSVKPGVAVLGEYDPKKPALDLEVTEEADEETDWSVVDYPGEYPDPGVGADLVRIRLEAERAERVLANGASDVRAIVSGHRLTLEGHPREEWNAEWLVVRAQHWGEQPSAAEEELAGGGGESTTYANQFECVPADVSWRPARSTPRPVVDGPQTAVVTGPSGEEIHTDEFGRVKVRFRWDRSGKEDDKSSCWIRVAQTAGGAGFGAMFLPRVGQEVIVEFLEGEPDRPLVTGRLYNGIQPTPYELPAEKTKSVIRTQSTPGGGGSNEIMFEDAAGSEMFFMHAQKDMNVVVLNHLTEDVTVDAAETVGGNRTVTIKGNETISIKGNRTETVGGDETLSVTGSQSVTIGANQFIKVKGDLSENVGLGKMETVGAAKLLSVKGAHTVTVGAAAIETITAAKVTNVKGDMNETVGGAMVTLVGGAVAAKIGETLTEDVGGAMTEKAGGAWKVEAGGAGSIVAAKVMIVASSIKLTAGGSEIAMSDGEIKIKSSAITLDASTIVMKGSDVKNN